MIISDYFQEHEAITPSDTVNLKVPMAIRCGSAGNVALVNSFDVVLVYTVVAGETLKVLAKRINATGTTATGLIGMYD